MGFSRSVPHQLSINRHPSRQSAEIVSCLKAGVVKGHGALYVFFPLRPALFLAVADIGL